MRLLPALCTFLALLPCAAWGGDASPPPCERAPAPAVHPCSTRGPGLDAWLRGLPPWQQVKAQAVVDAYSPRIQDLRRRITGKKAELARLRYSQSSDPDSLPRLGRELQDLRDELRGLLMEAGRRLEAEAGVPLPRPRSRGCRMALLPPAGE